MPICGCLGAIDEIRNRDSWSLETAVRPAKLRDRFVSNLRQALQPSVSVRPFGEFGKLIVTSTDMEQFEPVQELLDLLGKCVTIDDIADTSLALAIHRFADIDEHSYVGELVNRAKYYNQPDATTELTEAVIAMIGAHSLYKQATYVTCPPSNAGQSSGGLAGHLADSMSQRLWLQRLPMQGPLRNARKEAEHQDDCSDVHGKFRVSHRLSGETILVVDDLYGAGCTTDEAVRALRAAGARRVLVLTASKTAKRCNGLPAHSDNWLDWIPAQVLGDRSDLPFE